jgi:hypothetical protein
MIELKLLLSQIEIEFIIKILSKLMNKDILRIFINKILIYYIKYIKLFHFEKWPDNCGHHLYKQV